MHSISALLLTCLAGSVIELTYAQSVHTVQVGDTGSFYDPQVTTARNGDTVSFQWTGALHSVTQSSFDNPCTPLPGGFDSGIAGNQPTLLPEWNLTITDDTQPLWFFCKFTSPVSHCTNGMVGAINAQFATGNQSFNNFSQNAKLLTNPPILPHGQPPVLTGVGAFATNTPIPVLNGTNSSAIPTSTTSSSVISTTSSTPTPTPTQNTQSGGLSTGEVGGIAGGTVGGVLLAILLVLLFLSYRRGRRYRKEAKSIAELRTKSSRDMSHIDRMDLLYDTQSSPPPLTPSQQVVQMHRSQGSASVHESLERESTSGPSINVKELAAEIAKNMRQEMNAQDRSGVPQESATLPAVPEQAVVDAVSRIGSARATAGRQLPLPPASRADVRSIDTLPAYVPGR